MPRGTKVTKRRGAAGPRRKTGCYTCRARHVRCDEEKPKCGNCFRKGYNCVPAEIIISSTPLSATTNPPQRGPLQPQENHQIDDGIIATPSQNSLNGPCVGEAIPSKILEILDPETTELLRIFQDGIAIWMDLFDHNLHYQREVLRRAWTSSLIRKSICALSAKQLELISERHVWTSVVAKRYGESLRLLINACADPNAEQKDIFTATTLLSSVELLFGPGSDHQKHLLGGATLIKSRNINATCSGLERACFWLFVRHDLAMALINECPTLIHPDEWNVSWSESSTEEDELGNHIIWLCSRIANFVFGIHSSASRRQNADIAGGLMEAIDAWFERVPQACKGVPCRTLDRGGLEQLWFPVPAAPAMMATYHEAKLLLLGELRERVKLDFTGYPDVASQIQYHAMRIASIGTSKIHDGPLVQAVQPLYFAAKYVNELCTKAKIWSVLSDIEMRLGFPTASRIDQLQKMVDVL